MAAVKKLSCRLCLKTDWQFEVIDDFIKDILGVLFLKLKFNESKPCVMCTSCDEKLKQALEFKSTCLESGDTIYPYINCKKKLQIDLKEIYIKEVENRQGIQLPSDQNVCCLCMRLVVDEFIDVHENEVDAIHKFIPEMNISIIKGPVMCKLCLDSLNMHNNFLNGCLEIEEKNEITCASIGTSQSDIHSLNLSIEADVKIKLKEECEEALVEFESMDVKFEEQQEGIPQYVEEENQCSAKKESGPMEVENVPMPLEIYPLVLGYLLYAPKNIVQTLAYSKIQPREPKHNIHKLPGLGQGTSGQTYKCDKCPYEVQYKRHLAKHKQTHESHLMWKKCEECEYQSTCSKYFRQHQLRHEEKRGPLVYKCDKCKYQTKVKYDFNQHQWKHGGSKETRIYKCKKCEYQTAILRNLRRHQARHKVNRIYKCEDCEYQTTVRIRFRYHLSYHRRYKVAQMYKCDKCKFRSKTEQKLYKHQLKHEASKEKQIYKCEKCEYQSTIKTNLHRHEAKHRKM